MNKDIKILDRWLTHDVSNNRLTNSYSIWNHMKARCNPLGEIQNRQPTYIGCHMSENFKNFQYFAEWCQTQVGYGLNDYQLDKDILVIGNKFYSENTCVFVPKKLNMLFVTSAIRKYPMGVDFVISRNKPYRAKISVDNKYKHIGWFSTAKEASNAYTVAKNEEIQKWIDKFKNGELIVDHRIIHSMKERIK